MTKPADSFSVLQAAALLGIAGDVERLLDEDQVLDARVVGGAQSIPLGLAERLGDARRARRAGARRRLGRSAACGWRAGGHAVAAAAAVIAVPPNLLPLIRFDPPLPARRMQAEQWLAQGALIKVQAAYRSRSGAPRAERDGFAEHAP